ncbi:HAD hydrolase-like protein [Paenarthrobacter sp. GOM3]|uniref:HAD hydrolase-like protein n=1 Tax=Paenarthrobacter sp. GOM3 TaxID=2782567 RepID=UPI0027DBDD8F|nr:HAD hydrolase-like protein [Paenarthrobacter sp. GOM3]WOH18720.1 HAD hydrolase-like protein [Paenarthrobacter sp. GOM3]
MAPAFDRKATKKMIRPEHQEPLPERYSCVLFDMDGTLVDSASGVTASAAEALLSVGATIPGPDQLRRFVGPPMIDSFRAVVGLDEDRANEALQHYRVAYARAGALQARLYEGVEGLLQQLHSQDMPMAVATSKVEDQAIRLTRHFGVDHFFSDVCGASDALGRSRKDAVIAESLRRLRSRGVDTSRPVMVGDRIYDIEGAATFRMPAIFALWGYGEPHESVHAIATASSPSELLPLLQGTMQDSTTGQ